MESVNIPTFKKKIEKYFYNRRRSNRYLLRNFRQGNGFSQKKKSKKFRFIFVSSQSKIQSEFSKKSKACKTKIDLEKHLNDKTSNFIFL